MKETRAREKKERAKKAKEEREAKEKKEREKQRQLEAQRVREEKEAKVRVLHKREGVAVVNGKEQKFFDWSTSPQPSFVNKNEWKS